jgi:ketosteroid isomerase-like protein
MKIGRRIMTAGIGLAGLAPLAVTLAAPSADDAEAVKARAQAHRNAMMASDAKALDELSAPELSYGHSDGHIEDKATFIANATNGKSHWLSLTYEDVTARVVGDTAISRFRFVGESESGEKKSAANLGVLMIWQKQDGVWKLLARQSTKLGAA